MLCSPLHETEANQKALSFMKILALRSVVCMNACALVSARVHQVCQNQPEVWCMRVRLHQPGSTRCTRVNQQCGVCMRVHLHQSGSNHEFQMKVDGALAS
eukprot:1055382-Pelagomonas_calceolata.AAC.5